MPRREGDGEMQIESKLKIDDVRGAIVRSIS